MQVEVFPLLSVTVSVTVLGPTLVQLNVEGETEIEAIPHASELPLLICDAVMLAAPAGFNWMVISWQIATGGVMSFTVTVAVQVETFPFTSVTVNVTVFAPTFEQEKLFGDTLIEAIPQLSELPLLTWAAVIVAAPEAFRLTEILRHKAVGGTLSTTVTVDKQVATFPLLSVTVKVTVLAPTLEQLNVEGETERDAIPHASDDPLLT